MAQQLSMRPVLLTIFLAINGQEMFVLFALAEFTALEGRDLIVAFTKTNPTDVQIIRNATGYIVEVLGVGPLMLSWLSIDYNFTWSILQTKEDFVVGLGNEGVETSSGQLRYHLENGMCDLVVGTVAQFYSRVEWMDFLHGYGDGSVVMIIPNPQPVKYNVRAIVKPFQFSVWIGLFLALLFTLFAFFVIQRFLMKYRPDSATNRLNSRQIFYYVIRLILNQGGGFLASRRLALRLVAGALCILAFVLVTAYQSVLISFILAPGMQPPIISSVSDLAKKTDVHLVVDKGMAIDVFLTSFDKSVAMQNRTTPTNISKLYQSLGKKVKDNAKSRCFTEQRCIDLVKEGKSVYVKPNNRALRIIEKDFHDSGGQCNLAISSHKWTNTIVGWAMPKNSPYTETLNMGILRMNEAGLTNKWRERYEKGHNNRCTDAKTAEKERKTKKHDQRITLQNMSGSFVVLLVGIFCSVIVFIIELILRSRESDAVVNLSSTVPSVHITASIINHINDNNTIPSALPSDVADQLNKDDHITAPDKESSVTNNQSSKPEVVIINPPNAIEMQETADTSITLNRLMENEDIDKGINASGYF